MAVETSLAFAPTITPRPYQSKAVEMTWEWLRQNEGHPCLVLPTGAGKSIIIAMLCKDAIQGWPGTKILMLTHVKELISQNAEKMRSVWPNAPLGIFSAGLGRKEIDAITFGGIQSLRGKAYLLGHQDLIIIDEAHTISHKDEGAYRELLKELQEINPSLRIIGLTASPWRLGHGLVTEKPAIFDALIEPVTIEELQNLGHLAQLRSKTTTAKLDTDGVHKRGGDFIESELQAHVDTEPHNVAIVEEVIARAEGRKSWLFFCAGVKHAEHVRDALRVRGISAEMVTGETQDGERAEILRKFKSGEVRAVTNVMVLSTGFDHPGIDLIALLRATESPGLFLQQVGRGFRVKPNGSDCLILDFAGLVARHGPVVALKIPTKYGESEGIPPSKACPECGEIVATATRICPACNFTFPPLQKEQLVLRNDDIMGREPSEMIVSSWTWSIARSKKSDQPMIVVSYYGRVTEVLKEYLCIWHDGFAGQKGRARLNEIAKGCHVPVQELTGDDATERLERAYPPTKIFFKMEGKYQRIVGQEWAVDDKPLSPMLPDYSDEAPF
jgi:DNA repair protein RadD